MESGASRESLAATAATSVKLWRYRAMAIWPWWRRPKTGGSSAGRTASGTRRAANSPARPCSTNQELIGVGAAAQSSQGESVALSGDGNTVLIGGPQDNLNHGAV